MPEQVCVWAAHELSWQGAEGWHSGLGPWKPTPRWVSLRLFPAVSG